LDNNLKQQYVPGITVSNVTGTGKYKSKLSTNGIPSYSRKIETSIFQKKKTREKNRSNDTIVIMKAIDRNNIDNSSCSSSSSVGIRVYYNSSDNSHSLVKSTTETALAETSPPSSVPTSSSSTTSSSSSSTRLYNMSIITWNMGEIAPSEEDCAFIRAYRSNDFVVFGLQECEDIRIRRHEGHRSRKWKEIQNRCLGPQFMNLCHHKMGGLMLNVYCKKKIKKMITGFYDVMLPVHNDDVDDGIYIYYNYYYQYHHIYVIHTSNIQ